MKHIFLFVCLFLIQQAWSQCTNSKPMSSKDFKAQLKVIESAEFMDTRKQLSTGLLKENCISVKQLNDLLSLFNFEEAKMNVAKKAYLSVVDRKNFRTIYPLFKHEYHVREIESYIQSL